MVTAPVHAYTLLQRTIPAFAAVPSDALDWIARFLYVLYAVTMLHRAYRTGWAKWIPAFAGMTACSESPLAIKASLSPRRRPPT
jgi:hypothetical protein